MRQRNTGGGKGTDTSLHPSASLPPLPQRTDSAFYPWETSAPGFQPVCVNWCPVSIPKPTWGQAWGSTGVCLGGRWRGDGALGVGSRTDVHSWWARGWVASARVLSHVLSLLRANPPVAAFLNWGVGEQDVAGHSCHTLISVYKKWEGRGDTHRGLFWLSAREERKEQEGLKINVFVLPY